ncbi:MAG: DNA processing protein [Flavobacteriaceae bacterium]
MYIYWLPNLFSEFMLSKDELCYTLALQRVPNLGDTSAKKLLQFVGSAEGIFKEKRTNLLKIDGIGALKLKDLNASKILIDAERELEYIDANAISYSFFKDNSYPERLKHCLDGPLLIFYRGNIDLESRRIISVVGTRNITTYGRDFCLKLINELAPTNPIIVSGFAYGVDIAAHKAAIDNGLQTIGCLAHGLNQIYPKVHKKYVSQVEENGGFITEFWSRDAFDRTNFLKRNRIIAGMSEATIVIESAEKGGSLVTADIANSYNREVFAAPGRTSDSQSQGCNNLIKTQQARLLTSAADIVYMLGWKLEDFKIKPQQKQLFVELSPEEKVIYDYLKDKEKQVLDIIALNCKMPTFKASSLLLSMELKGVIRPLPGKLFQII